MKKSNKLAITMFSLSRIINDGYKKGNSVNPDGISVEDLKV